MDIRYLLKSTKPTAYKQSYLLYSTLISLSQYVHIFFPLQFSTLNNSHHTPFLYVSIPPLTVAFEGFVAIKQKYYCTVLCTEGAKVTVSWITVALHCANSVYVPHRWLQDPSHTVPPLTISILSPDKLYTHSPKLKLTHKSYYRRLNSTFSLTLYLRRKSLYTKHVIRIFINSVLVPKVS